MTVRPARTGALGAAAVVLLVGGCSGAPTAAPSTVAAAPTPTASPTPTPPASVQCLESGTWVVDNAREAELFAEGLRGVASDVAAARTGEATFVFEDGVLTRTFTAWQLSFSAVLGGAAVTEATTLGGATTAAYEVTETDVVTQPADVAGLTIDTQATRGGAPVTFDDPGSGPRENQQVAQRWGFTCDDTTLLLANRRADGSLAETVGTILLQRR